MSCPAPAGEGMAHGRNFPHLCLHLAEQRDFRSCWLQKAGPEVPCPMPFGVLFLKPALKLLLHTSVPRGPAEEMNAVGGPTLAVTQAGPAERGGLKINHNRRAIKPFGVSQSQSSLQSCCCGTGCLSQGQQCCPSTIRLVPFWQAPARVPHFARLVCGVLGLLALPYRAKGTSHRTGQAWGLQPSGTLFVWTSRARLLSSGLGKQTRAPGASTRSLKP